MKFADSEAKWHGCLERGNEVGHSNLPLRNGGAVRAERQLSARCKLASPRGCDREKESSRRKAGIGGRWQEAVQTKLHVMSWRLGAGSEKGSRFTASGGPGSKRWSALLENHEWQSGSWHALIQRNSGTSTVADCATSADTQAGRQEVARDNAAKPLVHLGSHGRFLHPL